jgi:ERF superfamily protein
MSDTIQETSAPVCGHVAPIPGSIVKAICRIMASVDAIKKSQRNAHGGYNYASTDDIYAEITRKMGEVGLAILCLEEEPPKIERVEKDSKTSQWGRFVFSFVLATEEATWSDPRSRRSIFLQITGPQAHMAAQSYCEKSFMRSTFKLATGDMDLDGLPQADTEEDQIALSGGNGKAKRKSSYAAKKDGGTEVFNELRGKISRCDTPDQLMTLRTISSEAWEAMPARWGEILEHEYQDRMDEVRGAMA